MAQGSEACFCTRGIIMHVLEIYIAQAKLEFLQQTQYRFDFYMRTLAKFLMWGSGFLMIYVLLYRFETIGGWNTYEILFLYALNVMAYAVANTFCNPFNQLSDQIQSGTFDSILVKPVNPFFFYLSTNTSAGYISNYVICFVIMVISLTNLQITLTPIALLYLILAMIGGALIHAAAVVITNVPAFWLTRSRALSRLFYWNLERFLTYPISIYNRFVQILLTFIIPYAFINFYPAQFILDKDDFLGFPPFFAFLTPAVGALVFFIAYKFWNHGLNHYKSTGS